MSDNDNKQVDNNKPPKRRQRATARSGGGEESQNNTGTTPSASSASASAASAASTNNNNNNNNIDDAQGVTVTTTTSNQNKNQNQSDDDDDNQGGVAALSSAASPGKDDSGRVIAQQGQVADETDRDLLFDEVPDSTLHDATPPRKRSELQKVPGADTNANNISAAENAAVQAQNSAGVRDVAKAFSAVTLRPGEIVNIGFDLYPFKIFSLSIVIRKFVAGGRGNNPQVIVEVNVVGKKRDGTRFQHKGSTTIDGYVGCINYVQGDALLPIERLFNEYLSIQCSHNQLIYNTSFGKVFGATNARKAEGEMKFEGKMVPLEYVVYSPIDILRCTFILYPGYVHFMEEGVFRLVSWKESNPVPTPTTTQQQQTHHDQTPAQTTQGQKPSLKVTKSFRLLLHPQKLVRGEYTDEPIVQVRHQSSGMMMDVYATHFWHVDSRFGQHPEKLGTLIRFKDFVMKIEHVESCKMICCGVYTFSASQIQILN